ncbi:MAG: Hsp70 family protein, partial [Spirochaetaceae bacterium]|nr:Hsp70 family protein [Spirochaetaceae bacterium]
MIGIKIADGTYSPILDESSLEKKRVILTTVKDDQESVQIDVYRGSDDGMDDPQYLDTLKFDRIEEAPEGEPEIELIMGIDEDGKLLVTVKDLKSGNEESYVIDLDEPKAAPFAMDEPDFGLSSSASGTGGAPSYSAMNGQSV